MKNICAFVLISLMFGCMKNLNLEKPYHHDRTSDVGRCDEILIGVTQVARVGNMLVKDGMCEKTTIKSKKIEVLDDFVIESNEFNRVSFNVRKGTYKVIGLSNIDGVEYNVVRIPTIGSDAQVLVKEDGSIYREVAFAYFFTPGRTWSVVPSYAKFESVEEDIEVRKVLKGVETSLYYNGLTAGSIDIRVEEVASYSKAMVVPHNVSYDRKQNVIAYKNILIRVLEANNEYIKYQIVER